MSPRTYYNEIDADAALILRQLIADDVIAPGDVDTRSIKDVSPDDLDGYTQCHFFAGGGLWSVAARLAGWPDSLPLWTGSCPCQPFSVAGKGAGADDPRHLWPDFHRLISAGRPPIVVGEQVAGSSGYGWLDGVRADLEDEGYASRGVDIPACAIDAPIERNRLYWVALAKPGRSRCDGWQEGSERQSFERTASEWSDARPLVGTQGVGWREGRPQHELRGWRDAAAGADGSGPLGSASSAGLSPSEREAVLGTGWWNEGRATEQSDVPLPRRNGSFWADAEWIECIDRKARRAQPGTPLLVDGLPGRVGLWRVVGNAISPVLAAEVLGALLDTLFLSSDRRAAS